jgi:hypothetical protein
MLFLGILRIGDNIHGNTGRPFLGITRARQALPPIPLLGVRLDRP